MHILWINEVADFTGGCERYIADTVRLLKKYYKTEATLLYGVEGWTETKFLKIFDHAFPIVKLQRQIQEINPDIIYVHRLSELTNYEILAKNKKPVIRFFHDHKLFCLREHKYTAIGNKTCTKPIGLHCYLKLGFIKRKLTFPYIKFSSLPKFKYEQKLNKKLDSFVVASDYMKDHLLAHKFPAEKINVIPLFSTSEAKEISTKKDILLFVGQIVRGKGIDTLLQAMKLAKTDKKLLICGSGKQETEFQDLTKKLGIEEKVNWLGKVKRKELDSYYRNALCLLMPSRVPETFGLTGLEAMSYGTPVIASNVGGIGQWLKDGENGFLVPPNDPQTLAKKLEQFLSDQKEQKRMQQEAIKAFSEKFRSEFHIEKLYQLFIKLIAGGKNEH